MDFAVRPSQHVGVALEHFRHQLVIRTKVLLSDTQRTLVDGLGVAELTLCVIDPGQPQKRQGDIRVTWPKRQLEDFAGLEIQRLSRCKRPLLDVEPRKVLEADRHPLVSGAKNLRVNTERLLVQRFGLRQTVLRAERIGEVVERRGTAHIVGRKELRLLRCGPKPPLSLYVATRLTRLVAGLHVLIPPGRAAGQPADDDGDNDQPQPRQPPPEPPENHSTAHTHSTP